MAAPALDPYAQPMGHLMAAPTDPRLAVPGLDEPLPSGTFAAQDAERRRAFQQQGISAQQHALELQKEQDRIAAALRASQYATDPATRGKAFYELTPEQQREATGKSTAAPEIPGLINSAQSNATGRPVGANVLPGETASGKVGDVSIGGIQSAGVAGTTYDTLSDSDKRIVDAIASYQLPPPTSRGGFPPAQRARIMAALTDKYGPESEHPYSAAEFPSRQAALTDFKSGPSAKNITSINTVIGHLAGLGEAVKKLGNTNTLPGIINPVANAIGGAVSSDTQSKLANFNSKADAVASELGKVFGGNQPAVSLIKEWRHSLDANASPQAQNAAIESVLEMLGSRLNSLQDQWDKGVKNERNVPFLTPKSREILDGLAKNGIVNANHSALDPVGANAGTPSPATPQSDQLSPQDKAAIDWANANPTDPRAAQIKTLHGIQ